MVGSDADIGQEEELKMFRCSMGVSRNESN